MPTKQKPEFAEELAAYRAGCALQLPKRSYIHAFVQDLLELLFPHFSFEVLNSAGEVSARIGILEQRLLELLLPIRCPHPQQKVVETFFAQLPEVHRMLVLDSEALFAGDPAAESVEEVILAYPGFLATAIYRIAHEFYHLQVPLFPRIVTEYAHQITGIDIHPGAHIGRSFFIDHGTGVVVGETTEIGDNVKIYQGVTLGALSVDKALSQTKRHPTIEDRVVIYSNATILGGTTNVGHDSVIGGNVWLTESVPPHSTVYQQREVKVRSSTKVHGSTKHGESAKNDR